MKKLTAAVLGAAILTFTITGTAQAGDGAAAYTAKGCLACHGADGLTPITPAYPKISGQSKEYIIQQLTDIKSGARNNGQSIVMKGIMAAVSDEEIADIADFLSGQ